jgi:hypothetical protein
MPTPWFIYESVWIEADLVLENKWILVSVGGQLTVAVGEIGNQGGAATSQYRNANGLWFEARNSQTETWKKVEEGGRRREALFVSRPCGWNN